MPTRQAGGYALHLLLYRRGEQFGQTCVSHLQLVQRLADAVGHARGGFTPKLCEVERVRDEVEHGGQVGAPAGPEDALEDGQGQITPGVHGERPGRGSLEGQPCVGDPARKEVVNQAACLDAVGQSLQLAHARLPVALVGLKAAQDLRVVPHAPEEGTEALELVGSEAAVETAASHLGSAKQRLYRGVPSLDGVRGRERHQHPLS